MSGSVLKSAAGAPHLGPLWREYWAHSWDRMPKWIEPRLDGFMSAAVGRETEYLPMIDPSDSDEKRRINRAPIVHDYPTGKGAFIGAITRPAEASGVVQFEDSGHLLTVAPTRTGKGTSHIIPNLLLYAGSAVVIDIKGENYAITSRARAEMYDGATVYKFAPFEDDTHRYNPLDFIRSMPDGGASVDTYDDARLVAEMLIPGGKSNEPYWDIEARNIATMLLIYVAISRDSYSPSRNMEEVARLLFQESKRDEDDEKASSDGISSTIDEIYQFAQKERYQPLLSLITGFRDHERKLRASILSSCRADMWIWTSPRLQDATRRSDFYFDELKASMCRPIDDNPAPTTLYIVIPPEHLQSYRSVLRTIIGLAVVQLTRESLWKPLVEYGWEETPPCPVMFLLDELPALGQMDPIVNGLSYLAGYGVQLWSFVQNLGQLKEIYREAWHNFPANSAVTTFFGVNDYETADYVAKQLGRSEEYIRSLSNLGVQRSDTFGDHSWTNTSSKSLSESKQYARQELATAADVRATHKDLQYVFVRNRLPILATRVDYFNLPLFEEMWENWSGGDR